MQTKQSKDNRLIHELSSRINPSIPVPLYYQLKQFFLEKIKNEELKDGDILPTEEQLCSSLNISRPTIRQCMQELVLEGYLSRKKGKGTFVRQQKMEFNYFNKHEGNQAIIAKYGYTPKTVVIAFHQIAPIAYVNTKLSIPQNDPLLFIRRQYFADDEPILYSETYLQASRFPNLNQYDFSNSSLYQTLERDFNAKVSIVIREVGAENAGQPDITMLNVSKGAAILTADNLAIGTDNRPIEYTMSRCKSEIIKFTNYLECD